MAGVYQGFAGSASTNANATRHFALVDKQYNGFNTLVNMQAVFRSAGTLSKAWVWVSSNTVTATSTFRSQINALDGNIAVSITASTTGEFEDASGSDSITAGDLVSGLLTAGATGTSMTIIQVSSIFTANTNTVKRFARGQRSLSSGTSYSPIGGEAIAAIGQTNAEVKVQAAGTLKNLAVNVTVNASATSTFSSLINGLDGTLTVSISTNATGWFEDTGNSDSISEGDLICLKFVIGSGTNFTTESSGVEWQTTDGDFQIISFGLASTSITADSWFVFSGGTVKSTSSNTNIRAETKVAMTLSHLVWRLSQMTGSGPTLALQKNGSSTALSISAVGTGIMENSSDTVDVSVGDELNYFFDWVSGTNTHEYATLYAQQSVGVSVNVFDSPSITESITVLIPTLVPSVFDSPSLTESIVVDVKISLSVFDSPSLTESVDTRLVSYVDVFDAVVITESVTVQLVSYVSVTELPVLTESVLVLLPVLFASVSDTPSLTEVVSFEGKEYISVFDTPGVVDVPVVLVPILRIDIFDAASLVESTVVAVSMTVIPISVSDDITIVDPVTMEIRSYISVFDTGSITESVGFDIISYTYLESSHVAWGLKVLDF